MDLVVPFFWAIIVHNHMASATNKKPAGTYTTPPPPH